MNTEENSELPEQNPNLPQQTSQNPADNVLNPQVITSQPPASGTNENKPPGKIHKHLSNKKLLGLILVVVLVAAAAAAYLIFGRHQTKEAASQQKATVATNQQTAKNSATKLPAATVINGNTYFDSPKPLGDLGFFKNTDVFGQDCPGPNGTNCQALIKASEIKYFQIGTTKDGKQIIVFVVPNGIESTYYLVLGNSSSSYDFLAQMSQDIVRNPDALADYQKSFSSIVNVDKTSKLTDVSFPATVTINGQNLKSNFDGTSIGTANFMGNGLKSIRGGFINTGGDITGALPQKIASKDNLTYYRYISNDKPTFQVVEMYAAFNNLFSQSYKPAGEIASNNDKLPIHWSSGESNSSIYFSGGQGCGSSGYVIAKNIDPNQLTVVGKSPKGQILYQLPASSALVQEIYNKDYSGGDSLDDASLKNLTIQQMTDKHAYFLAQNGFNEYMLFQRDDMFIRGGCAKPVIYLYPLQTMDVSVSVGARITKSAPTYLSDGWQNVTARPDGNLSYEGSNYPYLYWEGYGEGVYPDINSGTIVKSSEAANAIKQQLAQQGLNAKEISDFMDFWSSKLPKNQPYTRLTWLATAQMNRLAPLNITPAPQTLIRVFLDFEGVDKPYKLSPQKLSAPKRAGFTVVEWGGLLRTGLH